MPEVAKPRKKKKASIEWQKLKEWGIRPQECEKLVGGALGVSPAIFGEHFLGYNYYPKQREALDAFAPHGSQVSMSSCNDGGKTWAVMATCILWHLWMYPDGKFACTSGKYSQIEEQIMPALWAHKKKFPNWKWYDSPYIGTEGEGFFTGFSTDKPGLAEGFHGGGVDKPLAFGVDEAKSAEPWLEGVVEGRIHPERLIIMSSQGYAEGWFYDSQTRRKADFKVVNQRAEDCPHITPEHILAVKRKWGNTGLADSILGHGFMPLVADAVIDYKTFDWLLEHPPAVQYGEVHAFCDFAWSNDGDESVLAVRNGNKITIEATFRKDSLHEVCNEFEYHFKRLNLKPHQISGDEGGGGQLVMDEFDRRGWLMQRWNNGAAATEPEHFKDCKAQVWYNFGQLLDMKNLILPRDDDLRMQLVNRKRKTTGNTGGKLAIETKAEMKERGVASPDRADAVCGAAMPRSGWWGGGSAMAKPMMVGGWRPMGGA